MEPEARDGTRVLMDTSQIVSAVPRQERLKKKVFLFYVIQLAWLENARIFSSSVFVSVLQNLSTL